MRCSRRSKRRARGAGPVRDLDMSHAALTVLFFVSTGLMTSTNRLGPQPRDGAPPVATREQSADAPSGGIARQPAELGEEGACDERGIRGRQALVVEELRREPPVPERVAGPVGDGSDC